MSGPIKQPIVEIMVGDFGQGMESYRVGRFACTNIEAIEKPGEYAAIPWVRVWGGKLVLFECCQHRLAGIFYGPPEGEPAGNEA